MVHSVENDWSELSSLDAILEMGLAGQITPPDWTFGTRVQQWWERLLHRPPRPLFLDPSKGSLGILLGTATRDTDTSELRLATNAARHNWKVVQFDPLGSHARAATFLAAMQQAGLQDIRVFPHEAYNGWQVTPELLQHHLLNEMPFYRGPYQQHLTALCLEALFAHKPVADLKDLFQRLIDLPHEMWGFTSRETKTPLVKYLREVPRQEFVDLAGRFGAFATLLGDSLDGKWSLEQVDAAYLCFDALTHPLRARTQAAFLLADLVRYLTRATRSKKRVLLLLRHPELLFDLEEQLVPFLSSIGHLGASVILVLRTPQDLGSAAEHILSLAHTVVIHRSEAWWTGLPSNMSMPRGRQHFPSAYALTQLPSDECLVFQGGSVSRVRVDAVRVPARTLHHASTALHLQETSSVSLFERAGNVEALFSNSLWSSAWGARRGPYRWALNADDSLLSNGLSQALSTPADTPKTGEHTRTRQRGKRGNGSKNRTHTRDSSSVQGEIQQGPGDEDLLI